MSEEDNNGDSETVKDALSVLAHEIRLDIVLALLEGWAGVHTEPRRFSELMDAVEVKDSGKFNYHLSRLQGVYVEKVEEGYVPTAAATALYRAVLAHRPTREMTRTGTIAGVCPDCGGSMVERYERSFLTYECTDCEGWTGVTYSFPANGLRGRTAAERQQAVMHRADYHIGLARTGQCPFCAGRVQVQFDPQVDWAERGESPAVELVCDTCSWLVVVPVLTPLQFEPRVSAALTRVGVDPPLTGFHTVETSVERVSEDPVHRAVTAETDEGTVTVVVDDELAVQSVDGVASG